LVSRLIGPKLLYKQHGLFELLMAEA